MNQKFIDFNDLEVGDEFRKKFSDTRYMKIKNLLEYNAVIIYSHDTNDIGELCHFGGGINAIWLLRSVGDKI